MIWKSRTRYGPLLQHHCQPPMAVAWAFTRWPSHFQLNCSARSPRSSGPSSILRLLTHVFSWPIFLLSLSLSLSLFHMLHMTLIHHCPSQASLCFCLVLSSCRDFDQRWHSTCCCTRTVDCLVWSGFGARRLHSLQRKTSHSSDVIFGPGDSVSGCFSPQLIDGIGTLVYSSVWSHSCPIR